MSSEPAKTDNLSVIDYAANEDRLPQDDAFLSRLSISLVLDPHIRRLHDGMTVAEVLQLALPDAALSDSDPPAFSSTPPVFSELNWARLQAHALPSRKVVDRLKDGDLDAWTAGERSITYHGVFFPFAVLTCWDLLHSATKSRTEWERTLSWTKRLLEQKASVSNEGVRGFIENTAELARSLRWNGATILDRVRVGNRELATLLSDCWITDDIFDLCLSVLRHDVQEATHLSSPAPRILQIEGTLKLKFLYCDRSYLDNSSTRYLRILGQDLAEGKVNVFAGIFHINNNHWVAVVADVPARRILYANPMAPGVGLKVPLAVEAVTWYLEQHQLTGFTAVGLKTVLQLDGFSCGILSYAALAHHFLPAQYPLPPPGPYNSSLARMSMFHRIVAQSTRTADRFSNVWMFAAREAPTPLVVPKMFLPPTGKRTFKDISDGSSDHGDSDHSHPNSHSAASDISIFTKVLLPKRERELASRKKRRVKKKAQNSQFSDGMAEPGLREKLKENSSRSIASGGPGRTADQMLEVLTVYQGNNETGAKQYICVGKGCKAKWSGRTKGRVLKHAAQCLHLPEDLRMSTIVALASMSTRSQVNTQAAKPTLIQEKSKDSSATVVLQPIRVGNPVGTHINGGNLREYARSHGRQERKAQIDHAILRLFVAAGLPPSLFDYPEWKDFCAAMNAGYVPLTRAGYSDVLLPTEQAYIQLQQLKYLKTKRNLTITFDGGTTRRQDGFYSVHVCMPEGEEFLVDMVDGRGVSHTGEWIWSHLLRNMRLVGLHLFAGIASDSTGNTKNARSRAVTEVPTLLNLPDGPHHLSNTTKDISKIDYFSEFIAVLRKFITHFSHAAHDTVMLDELRKERGIGRGLESIGKTRFATITWAALSVKRCLECIYDLVDNGDINLGCIEAASANASDVFVFWMACVASIKDALENVDLEIPSPVCEEIRGIINVQWREVFNDNHIYLAAFRLNPVHVDSDIMCSPNSLAPTITVRGSNSVSAAERVATGVKHAQSYLKTAKLLNNTAIQEILHGDNSVFTKWASKPKEFQRALNEQLKAFVLGLFPFCMQILSDDTPLSWWMRLTGREGSDLIAELAIKIFSVRPHSMADERTASVITWLNAPRRSQMLVSTLFAQAQDTTQLKVPVVKFYNLKRLLFSKRLDGSEGLLPEAEEDTADDSKNNVTRMPSPTPTAKEDDDTANPEPDATFDVEGDTELNLRAFMLCDVLADSHTLASASHGLTLAASGPFQQIVFIPVHVSGRSRNLAVDLDTRQSWGGWRPIRTFSSPQQPLRSRSPGSPHTPRSSQAPAYLARELGIPVEEDDLPGELRPPQMPAAVQPCSRNSSLNGRISAQDFDFGRVLGEGPERSYSTGIIGVPHRLCWRDRGSGSLANRPRRIAVSLTECATQAVLIFQATSCGPRESTRCRSWGGWQVAKAKSIKR
ncbi:hypothetical protein BC835DRAFT_1305576 [Cytidiella melzeri]|nr:hypothetical protein BC835DRAFT_1305576 [Cytidiella melzeri]